MTMSTHHALILLAVTCMAASGLSSAESPVLYTVTNAANGTAGGARFDTQIGPKVAKQTMYAATRYAWIVFNQTNDPSDRKNITHITLSVENYDTSNIHDTNAAVAYTTNATIHLNANFVGNYTGNLRRQFNGIMYEKVAGMWQWEARGQAPEGLVTGIAHYVRLQARYGTVEKVKPGEGERWDQGSGVTARFLTYCNQLRRGFVGELNKKMKYGYTDGFFMDLLGMPVDHVWSNYKEKYHGMVKN